MEGTCSALAEALPPSIAPEPATILLDPGAPQNISAHLGTNGLGED